MISSEEFLSLVADLGDQAKDDIEWAEGLSAPSNSDEFATEAIFVICNSGMKASIARQIFDRCISALNAGTPVNEAFGHKGKSAAIEEIWKNRVQLLEAFQRAPDQLAFCESLPWIGPITKYHLAKNFGVNCAKPDVHLQRLADAESTTPQALCERIAKETGYRVATVDTILWRACSLGIIKSRSLNQVHQP